MCFDLGTGTGEVLGNLGNPESLRIGIDNSMEALSLFDSRWGQPVLCPVEQVQRTFRKGCADLVLANPPYNVSGRGRPSPDPRREQARSADHLVLHRFIFAGAHLLRPGGLMIITERAERQHDIELGFMAAGFSKPDLLLREGVAVFSGSLKEPGVPQDRRGEVCSV